MNTMLATPTSHDAPQGGRLVSVDGVTLPLTGAWIRAIAQGGRARVELTQTFINTESTALDVVYKVPLPADGAVSGYRFLIGETLVEGEVHRKKEAREQYEQAILEGRTAGLLEQETSSFFTQNLGNIPPGETLKVILTVDQPLLWRDEGAWEWRFPMVIAPRYLANTPNEEAERLQIDVADTALSARFGLNLKVSEPRTGAWSSPSHSLTEFGDSVALSGGQLDRDVVVRWPVAAQETGVCLAVARPHSDGNAPADPARCAYARLGLIPPKSAPHQGVPRDLVLLLDISGSMHGEPLQQAIGVITELVQGLGPADHLEIVTFASAVKRWKPKPVLMDAKTKTEACTFLAGLRAEGGTDMHAGIRSAVAGTAAIAGVQRQILLVTDGYIGSEEIIMREILAERPDFTRVHTLAVGHAPNRTLTEGVARAGGGVEAFVTGPQDEVLQAADTLLKRMQTPLVVDVEISGDALLDIAPHRLPDLYAGAPAILHARVSPEGGTLTLRGRSVAGQWNHTVTVPATKEGDGDAAIATSWARERVDALELQRIAGQPQSMVDSSIAQLGLTFSIATRLTSWLAVSKGVLLDGQSGKRTVTQPHQAPAGVHIEAFGLRDASSASFFAAPPVRSLRRSAPAPRGQRPKSMKKERIAGMMAPPPPPSTLFHMAPTEAFEEEVEDKPSGELNITEQPSVSDERPQAPVDARRIQRRFPWGRVLLALFAFFALVLGTLVWWLW